MSVVISDTSPINYLIQIGQIDLLPGLFGEVIVPSAVLAELSHSGAPAAVREWASGLPSWAKVPTPRCVDPLWDLGAGETEAIMLAKEIGDTLLLMDERKGRKVAIENGLRTVGTLNILEEASVRGMVSFEQAIERLRTTNFHIKDSILDEFISRVRTRT